MVRFIWFPIFIFITSQNDQFLNENALPEIMEFEICDTPEDLPSTNGKENSIEEFFYENNAEFQLVTSPLLNAQVKDGSDLGN